MRRLAIAALSAGIVLSACTEEPRETPTRAMPSEPSQAKTVTGSCQTPFPITDLLMKAGAMFSGASVGNAADAKIQTIGDQCAKGKVGTARHEALTFVDWMLKKYGQDQLPNGSALKMTDVISTLFVAVGFQDGEIDPGAFGPGGAAGVYDENSTEDFLLQNENQSAAVLIRPGCLPTSLITMVRLPDAPQLINTGGRRQFPPFYDINAANPEGDKTIAPECADLLVGFCVDDAVLAQTDNPQIGHNKSDDATTEANEQGEFEVLRAADAGEYGELELAFCPAQANPGVDEQEFGLSPPGGLEGLARSAWHKAGDYVRPLADIVLPQQLHATALGGLGLGGGGRAISPHGVVDDVVLESTFNGDPGGQTFSENSTLTWQIETKGPSPDLFPRVRVVDFFDQLMEDDELKEGVSGVDVNVALVQVDGTGELTDGEGGTPGPVTADESGFAVFDDLRITEAGTYQLEFTIRGNTISLLSGEFTVAEAPSPGADIVVFNDLNMFDNTAAADPNNLAFYANLVSYTGPGTRAANTRVLVHRGHGVRCDRFDNNECSIEGWSTFENTMRAVGSGYTVDDVDDASAPLTTIASNVKVIILVLPMTAYSAAEINALKAFAGEGGRIVFVGEFEDFYGDGIGVENDFLTSMGAVMTNTGGAVDCADEAGYKVLPSTSLRSHQVTDGLTQLTIACASVVAPGSDDYPLFYDRSGESVLGAVAKVDLTPLPITLLRAVKVAPTSTPSAALSNDAAGRGVVSKVSAGAQR